MVPASLDLDQLFAAARLELANQGDFTPMPYMVELHERGSREIFVRACASCRSTSAFERFFGVRILRELGGSPPRFAEEAVPFLLAMLQQEPEIRVLRWVISALAYQHFRGNARTRLEPTAIVLDAVLAYATHPEPTLRLAVACHLTAFMNLAEPEASVIAALCALARDADEEVRWDARWALVEELGLPVDDVS
jgi:hypothetical protein